MYLLEAGSKLLSITGKTMHAHPHAVFPTCPGLEFHKNLGEYRFCWMHYTSRKIYRCCYESLHNLHVQESDSQILTNFQPCLPAHVIVCLFREEHFLDDQKSDKWHVKRWCCIFDQTDPCMAIRLWLDWTVGDQGTWYHCCQLTSAVEGRHISFDGNQVNLSSDLVFYNILCDLFKTISQLHIHVHVHMYISIIIILHVSYNR